MQINQLPSIFVFYNFYAKQIFKAFSHMIATLAISYQIHSTFLSCCVSINTQKTSVSLFQINLTIFSLILKGEEEAGAIALEMANVEGVFYLTIIGVLIAIILAFMLVVLETKSVCKENKVCSFMNLD